MFVTIARIGESFRNEPSLSSDSTTRKLLFPSRAFEPPMVPTRPPTTTVGSKPACDRIVAAIEVVVVLPWLPATAMPYFSRISSASSSPRGMTGIPSRRASSNFRILCVDRRRDHERFRAFDVLCRMAFVYLRAERLQTLRDRTELHVRTRDLVPEIQQNFGDAAHADTADAGEVQLLRLQKHLRIDWLRGVNESTDGHYRTFTSAHKFQQDVSSFLRCERFRHRFRCGAHRFERSDGPSSGG